MFFLRVDLCLLFTRVEVQSLYSELIGAEYENEFICDHTVRYFVVLGCRIIDSFGDDVSALS